MKWVCTSISPGSPRSCQKATTSGASPAGSVTLSVCQPGAAAASAGHWADDGADPDGSPRRGDRAGRRFPPVCPRGGPPPGSRVSPTRPTPPAGRSRRALVSADTATCADCLAELADSGDRRYGYPFINCTNCGPRFTIVTNVPYDRAATTMAGFEMCPSCAAEYL